MNLLNKLLLVFVVIGAVNIIILLIIKSKAKKIKTQSEIVENKSTRGIRALNYNDDELICMAENVLELQYGYECTDENILKNMKISHRNVYILRWFDKEVVSGGIGDYFFSVGNVTRHYIEEALEDIGGFDVLNKYKEILCNNDLEGKIKNICKRSVEEYSVFMSGLDFTSFDESYDHINMEILIANYIRKNICDFSDLSEEEIKIWEEINNEIEVDQNQ